MSNDLITVNGWNLVKVGDDAERRILDVELGERLGYADPSKVRRVIEGLIEDGELPDVLRDDRTVVTSMPRGGSRSEVVKAYYLTEREALQVIAKSRTKTAYKITNEIIDVYLVFKGEGMARVMSQVEALRDDLQFEIAQSRKQRLDMLRLVGANPFGLLQSGAEGLRSQIRKLRDALMREGFEAGSVRAVQKVVDNRVRSEVGYPCGKWEACPPDSANLAHSYIIRELDAVDRRSKRRAKRLRSSKQTVIEFPGK